MTISSIESDLGEIKIFWKDLTQNYTTGQKHQTPLFCSVESIDPQLELQR